MAVQPKAGIAMPQGNGKPAKEMFGGGGGVRLASSFSFSGGRGKERLLSAHARKSHIYH